MRLRTTLPFLAPLAVALPASASAPAATASPAPALSAGWTAWHGCWRPVGDDAPAGTLVCMLPADAPTDVRIVTLVDGAVAEETVLRADGVAREVEEGGCLGTETARWSADGRRVFVRAAFQCTGLGRTSTGILGMVAENEWIDAQALTVAGQHAARSVRYRAVRADDVPAGIAAQLPRDRRLAQETARLEASLPLDETAVVEASRAVAPPAVEALLAARQHGFAMNAAMVRRLEKAQVPGSTIDVMVALSFPQTFAVREQPRTLAEDRTTPGAVASRGMRECFDPFFMRTRYGADCDMYGYGYSRYNRYGYGYGSRYGYSPWGYDPFGWSYGRDPVVIIVGPGEGESARGEVVKGRGYTNPGTAGSGRAAQPRNEPARGTGAAAPASSPPASATSGNSSAGSGSSGTSTGRTAVPRPGGGDN